MNGTTLQSLIYAKGYAGVAAHAGQPFALYRPSGSGDPLAGGPLLAALPVCANQHGGLRRPAHHGEALWWSWHDGTQTQAGDYLVGDGGTFFIASQQALLPIQLVCCNRVLSIRRVTQATGRGAVAYGGEVRGDDALVLERWPASVLEGTKGESNAADLPLDVKCPWWRALLPAPAGVEIKLGDRASDELGQDYWVHSAELSALGWRLKLMQVQA